ncbi:PREDICTED: uncharacterized protein LOC105451850 [Wasmannia auropunctata]|uniref:uncharacterized protein LOC105451850 n=1 Tax=Wasmannia auropunctata TaxID=64793 RepID=UPI0005EDCC8A|nr:PREDICTED: uncharacterized protein LOC105451850 [Wasmannia auropunctata]
MEAVTATDYDSTNLSRNFNQVGFNTYNYSQFEEKYKPRQIFKYGDEYLEYGRRIGANDRFARTKHQDGLRLDQRYSRSHSQPERQHHLSSHETRSKSQDSHELTFYQIDPPVKTENLRQHDKLHQRVKKELTFYEIDGLSAGQERRDRSEVCKDQRADKSIKSHDKSHADGQERPQTVQKHGRQSHQEQQKTLANAPTSDCHQLNRSQSDLTECQLPNYCGHRNNPYIDPPKYRQFDRPPRYQETPLMKSEPPPKYHADPPKYTEVSRRQDDFKRIQTCDVRSNNNNNNNNNNNSKENLLQETVVDGDSRCHVEPPKSHHHHHHHHHQQHHQTRGIGGSNVASGIIVGNAFPDGGGGGTYGEVTTCDKHKGTGSESNRGGSGDAVQGRPSDRSMLKIEKLSGKAVLHGSESSSVGKCGAERMKSTSQEVGYNKHEVSKAKGHDVGHGYKVENLRYYGELKGYTDFKAYGIVDKQPASAHEKSHLLHAPALCEKGDKCHGKTPSSSSAQSYNLAKIEQQQPEKSHHGGDHYYHRSHSKPSNVYQVYQETKYSYNVSGVPGTPAQASAAAAFFARSVLTQSSEYDNVSRQRADDAPASDTNVPVTPALPVS